jgi:hypothetical protein
MCPSGATCLSIHGLLFQSVSTMKDPTKHVGLVQNRRTHPHLIEN